MQSLVSCLIKKTGNALSAAQQTAIQLQTRPYRKQGKNHTQSKSQHAKLKPHRCVTIVVRCSTFFPRDTLIGKLYIPHLDFWSFISSLVISAQVAQQLCAGIPLHTKIPLVSVPSQNIFSPLRTRSRPKLFYPTRHHIAIKVRINAPNSNNINAICISICFRLTAA